VGDQDAIQRFSLGKPHPGGIRTRGTEEFSIKMIKPNPLIAKGNPFPKLFCHERWKI
jgi:hypothetical protein